MRNIIQLALAGLLSVSTIAVAAESSPEALRIGYQKGSIGMVLAKSHQLLEKRYPQTKISWVEFPAGPQMLEALNVGSIDLAVPEIFRQSLPRLPGLIWCTWRRAAEAQSRSDSGARKQPDQNRSRS